ncbi:MAG: phytoene desaturase [Pseudomonadota bacterium]
MTVLGKDPLRPADPEPPEQAGRPRAVIVGAGFGGLAAAIRLLAKGYDVEVVDRLDMPGGRGTAVDKGGFRFDLGPTIVTAPHLFEELWQLHGAKMADDVTLRALDPFYTIHFPDGETFTARPDESAMEAEVARLSPGDLAGYRRFMADSKRRYEFGFLGLGRRSLHDFWDFAKTLPTFGLLRADRSVHAHAARRMRDPRLRMAMSFHPLFIGGDPFHVTSIYILVAYLEQRYGVHCAVGGAAGLAKAMARLIRRAGGRLRFGVEVERILLNDGRAAGVKLADGTALAADIVVSNADPGHTYTKLLPGLAKPRWSAPRLKRTRWSMSLFVWYFGTRGTRAMWPEVGHHTILNGPRYQELVRDIFIHGHLAEDMSLYLHRPAVTDPTAAPDGDDAFYALSPVPHLGFENGVDWREEAERYRQRVEARLEATLLPGLSSRVVESHVMTPLDFRDRYLSPLGAGFSIEPRILQSAWFRPHNVSEDVPGLYLVGAGTHPGAGLPGVISSAEAMADLIPEAVHAA